MTERSKAPVQGYSAGIPWSLHLRAWDAYAKLYGRQQSAERLAERGGFGTTELDEFVPGWRDEVSEITSLRAENERLRALLGSARPFVEHEVEHAGAKEDVDLLAAIDAAIASEQLAGK